MKNILLLLLILISFNSLSQSYNSDYNFNSKPFDRTWKVNIIILENQVIFSWEKDIITSIFIKSTDNDDMFFPKIDAFMTSQLVLNSLSKGKYKVIFLDDCNAIMDEKEFEIK